MRIILKPNSRPIAEHEQPNNEPQADSGSEPKQVTPTQEADALMEMIRRRAKERGIMVDVPGGMVMEPPKNPVKK